MDDNNNKQKIIDNIEVCLQEKTLQVFRLQTDEYIAFIETEGTHMFPLYSKVFSLALRAFYKGRFNADISDSKAKEIISHLEVVAYGNTLDYELSNRIYKDDEQIIYDLNSDGEVVWITKGEYSIEILNELYFRRNQFYQSQIKPHLQQNPRRLLYYVEKHFNLKNDNQVKTLAIYLASCFWGNSIQHPILYLQGDMGSSKSTSLRKIEMLVDPKSIDLLGVPKGMDGLELRLADSYFVALDNISYVSKPLSDILCRAVTGGSVTKRMLYENTREISVKIKALIGITSISMVFTEADILDRTLILNLQRLGDNTKTEQAIWDEFNKDMPHILGCCFACIAVALKDKKPVNLEKRIRLYDWEVCCVKIGRALGISDQKTAELLTINQREVNRETLNESVEAQCLIKFMRGRINYKSSVEQLLAKLKDIAEENEINVHLLPKTPNHLSRKLNLVKSCLEYEVGISYDIQNVGSYREIRIEKKTPKTIANIDSQKKKPLKRADRIKNSRR